MITIGLFARLRSDEDNKFSCSRASERVGAVKKRKGFWYNFGHIGVFHSQRPVGLRIKRLCSLFRNNKAAREAAIE